MDNEKLKAIQEWPSPQHLHELRSFIGLCSYYRRFIQGFATLAGPLHELTKKKVKFQWTSKEESAMEIYFYWPRMSHDIHKYISQCMVCQKMKYDRTKPYGLLQPLLIPEAP